MIALSPFPLLLLWLCCFTPPLLRLTSAAGYCKDSWGSPGNFSSFLQGPCLGVSGIGTTQSPGKRVYVIDRTDFWNTYLRFPPHSGQTRGDLAFAEELDLSGMGIRNRIPSSDGSTVDWPSRPLDVITNSFCSSGQFLPDGSFINIGGESANADVASQPGFRGNGSYSIRLILPSKGFVIAANMTSARWYPTTQIMPDGRVMIVGGSFGGVDLNYDALNNPTLEYYPRKPGEGEYSVQFLKDTLPYNLYPFLHLLPSGRVFMFASNSYILWDAVRNVQTGKPVKLPATGSDGTPVFFSYPLTATSAMFPLTPQDGYSAQIIICGGSVRAAKARPGRVGNESTPAHPYCHRIKPEDPEPMWHTKRMRVPRVMPNAVLLPDSTVLIIGGAQGGYAAIPDCTTAPVLLPEQYDTRNNRWLGYPAPQSKIPRLYHASALLLHDASVFVSGGNPNKGLRIWGLQGDTRFESEFYLPPYIARARGVFPEIALAPESIEVGGPAFEISVTAARNLSLGAFHVVLSHPGFATHSFNHGMRNVVLQVLGILGSGPSYQVLLKPPPSKNVAPPTWYWLFVVVNGVPNRDGRHVYISNKSPKT